MIIGVDGQEGMYSDVVMMLRFWCFVANNAYMYSRYPAHRAGVDHVDHDETGQVDDAVMTQVDICVSSGMP